jgi:glutathione S-transferase
MSLMQIVGRRSSVFTRLTLVFAEELEVEYELVPIHDMLALGSDVYADNPALKLPILRRNGSSLFGALNICRALSEQSSHRSRIVWPEDMADDLSRNAQELVWHCMGAQVQYVMGVVLGKLPADNIFFTKTLNGMRGSLRWLDDHIIDALSALPDGRLLSTFEASLFCLIEHLVFRPSVPLEPYPALLKFSDQFGSRASAQRTPYTFDAK